MYHFNYALWHLGEQTSIQVTVVCFIPKNIRKHIQVWLPKKIYHVEDCAILLYTYRSISYTILAYRGWPNAVEIAGYVLASMTYHMYTVLT